MPDALRLERERAFHDARFDGALSRAAQDAYYVAVEHGRDAYEARLSALAQDADALEVGCGTGGQAAGLLGMAASVGGIDISPVAVAAAQARGVKAVAGDAEATGLPTESVDLLFGAGIVHHLDTHRFAEEAARLLRPGGAALFWEPLGHNLAVNAYRRATPSARTADEHPLRRGDLRALQDAIGPMRLRFFGLATLPGLVLPEGAARRAGLAAGRMIDTGLLRVPGLRYQAWYVLAEFTRRG